MMVDIKTFIQTLFQKDNVIIPSGRENLFDDFVRKNADSIKDLYRLLMDNWKIKNRLYDIQTQSIAIPNATVDVPYQAKIDFNKLNLTDLVFANIEITPETGLTYKRETSEITGVPLVSGNFKFKFLFRLKDEQSSEIHEKTLSFFVNPDPKTLWKNLPSERKSIFWKKDNIAAYGQLGEKRIIAASKRGRSHQNVGSFRDDDFAFQYLEHSGWSVVAVADGAGSYALSREGSRLACQTVVEYFEQNDVLDTGQEFENKIQRFAAESDYTPKKVLKQEIENLSKQILYKAVLAANKKIGEVAIETQKTNPELFNNPKAKSVMDYFHTTLIFALFKRYNFGYLVLTFGVGDCPIAIMNKEMTETTLLNWLDVGEFGGGTRFVTQNEIFHSQEHPMASRFTCKIINDFSFLFLMTDGIYDPKFVVEANLEKHEKWLDFLADLQGKNEDCAKVVFDSSQTKIAPQHLLLKWLNFWDKGNHDDRTLIIIY